MQNNYHFLVLLAPELESKILGMRVQDIFSQDKDEMVIGFCKDETSQFYIKCSVQPHFTGFYFNDEFGRARRNSVNLWEKLLGKEVLGVSVFLNERAFGIFLEDELCIVFKLFGNRPNILLFENKLVKSLFTNKLLDDYNIEWSGLSRSLNQSYENFIENEGKIAALYPTLGKLVTRHFKNRALEHIDEVWAELQLILDEMSKTPIYLVKLDEVVYLSLFKIGEILASYDSAIEASNKFYIQFNKENTIEKEKGEALKILQKEKKKVEVYLEDARFRLEIVQSAVKNEEIAHIIMSNLHEIAEHQEEVSLFDFYRNTQIQIKLKPDLSPQKNAENYYRKAKNEQIEFDKLIENINKKEHRLSEINQQIADLDQLTELKKVRSFNKQSLQAPKAELSKEQLFKRFEFDGYEILVGKNAKNNDLLTQQYAHKEDLWLHARDAAGSHVIVKHKSGMNFSNGIIEKAASIAAWYSKRKNESLAAVIYTPKKYVRKTKDLNDGQVIVDKEKVIMVVPSET